MDKIESWKTAKVLNFSATGTSEPTYQQRLAQRIVTLQLMNSDTALVSQWNLEKLVEVLNKTLPPAVDGTDNRINGQSL